VTNCRDEFEIARLYVKTVGQSKHRRTVVDLFHSDRDRLCFTPTLAADLLTIDGDGTKAHVRRDKVEQN